ncbi:golgin subfamily A member 1-like isoform X2 [Homarus americanus]|uniref:golgin subfamily A member 1-like isoform X2 n=1 Tax=Homarus americanus TaxID=6706 RepID=UPI001C44E772|nr:golgin subfamily A member 1-like isoform X2 [Homarus americanus]
MFVNLKSKIGDVTDLKKLSSPQALASVSGSRQRSSQHTPGSLTPRSRHSRQASTASLQAVGLPISPPQSPTDQELPTNSHDRVQELEREIAKLRTALETQQDAALERLNTREQEWRGKLQEERDKISVMAADLEAAGEREKKLQEKVEDSSIGKKQTTDQLKQAQARVKGLEARICDMQENYDQMEGLNAQEMAKIKHMLLNTNSELEQVQSELIKKTEALSSVESRLSWASALEERIRILSEEKTELETQVAGLNQKLNAANARYTALEEAKLEESQHLQHRVITLEQRHSQTALQETDKVQALIKERENMEHHLEEARQQLNNIKASWSDKITALENQIHHLNAKIAEDQSDLQEAEENNEMLKSELSALRDENSSQKSEYLEMERKLQAEISQLNEDLDTLRWQLNNTTLEKDEQIKSLQEKLASEEEKHHSCASVLQSKLETIASLEQNLMDIESEVIVVKGNFTTTQSDLLLAQTEKKSLQETLQLERTTVEALEKGKSELQSKLDTVSCEKTRLSQNLDEYAEKVITLEMSVKTLEEEDEKKAAKIKEIEAKHDEVIHEREALLKQLENEEEDLVHKIEGSDVVKALREEVKTLEDEVLEKKQALKVQGQRLADMKKTIQRELKLSADSTDSIADPRIDSRIRDSSPATNANSSENNSSIGPVATNGSDNGGAVNNTYLKHVIIKYLTSREYEAVHLTRAVATLLQMTSEEERLLRETLEWKMSWFGSKPNLERPTGTPFPATV